jgi:hypothetical protein
MTQPSPSSLPSENFPRGVIFALIVLPLGIVAWDVLWSVGFVASIVAFGVSWGAVRLYRLGSGGRITRNGAIALLVVTIATLTLGYISGFAVDVVKALVQQGASVTQALSYPPFWGYVGAAMTTTSALVSLLLTVLFGVLGCFNVLRAAFRVSRMPQGPVASGAPIVLGTAPGAQPTLMNPAPPAPPIAPDPADPTTGDSK